MLIELPDHLVLRLLALPESGVGYQRVTFTTRDGRQYRDVLVFNAEVAEFDIPNFDVEAIVAVALEGC